MAFVAEAFTSAAVGLLLTQFGTPAFKKIASSRRVMKEVIRLEKTLNTIKGVLPHAEQLQATNDSVRSWLKDIKDLAYEAEDIIDDYLTEVRRRQLRKQDNLFKRVCHSPSSANTKFISPFKIVGRIKDVREKLRDILDNQAVVSLLQTGVVVRDQENSGFVSGRDREQTHSYILETEVFGRDVDREVIVKLLLDSSEQDDLTIIPILGMGGIGKTTLAKLVFNDERVIDKFKNERMWWVCVSDSDKNFSVQKLTRQIVETASGECPNLELQQLVTRLHKHLKGDKFLIVLDDIWNEDTTKWDDFKKLLPTRANGSKMIVTTRNTKVGLMMNSETYELSELHDEHCWELFKRRAYIKQEKQCDPELLNIGRDIVKKCKGVPLAAETLGGLCFGANKQTWERVRDNDLWNFPEEANGILRALRISYSYLPLDLKQCFAFCSVFPKNYKIRKDMLVASWVTLGFIRSARDMRSLEDIGNEFFEILIHASLIKQDLSESETDDLIPRKKFKMHDLVHDLAQVVSGGECFNICISEEERIPEGVRHLYCKGQLSSSAFETHCATSKPSKLRTLILNTTFSFDHIHEIVESLRVLHFKNNYIESLPDSIGKLKHLRYLTIRGRGLKELPESITDLQNLEILDISRLFTLKKLPESIGKLVILKHIHLPNRFQLSHIPSGLKKLTSLQTLPYFIVSKEKMGCKLNELYELTNIQGELCISGLENVKSVEETEKTNLRSKKNLKRLILEWGNPYDDNFKSQIIGLGVLANLEPHSNLKYFYMCGYVGTSFPLWMIEPPLSLNNVVEIELKSCHKCQQLPPLGLLPALSHLYLSDIKGARYFDHKLEESQKDLFPSLKSLVIRNAPNLKSWVSMESQQQRGLSLSVSWLSLSVSFPLLVELEINGCPKLRNMPLLPSIERVKLWDVSGELIQSLLNPNPFLVTVKSSHSLGNVVNIELRNIKRCQQLPTFNSLPSLQTLEVINVCDLRYFQGKLEESQKKWFPSLTDLSVVTAENLESWIPIEKPEDEGFALSVSFPCLRKLEILKCPRLKNMPLLPAIRNLRLVGISSELVHSVLNPNHSLVTLEYLEIKDCPDLEYLSEDGLQSLVSLTELHISSCKSLTSLSLTGNGMPHLQTLQLESLPKLVCLPQELQTLTELEKLYIVHCENLNSWPNWSVLQLTSLQYLKLKGYSEDNLPDWMANFTSLQVLDIYNCGNLQFLPEWVLRVDTTIKSITIYNCLHLVERYSEPTGEDWQRIAHIERRRIVWMNL